MKKQTSISKVSVTAEVWGGSTYTMDIYEWDDDKNTAESAAEKARVKAGQGYATVYVTFKGGAWVCSYGQSPKAA